MSRLRPDIFSKENIDAFGRLRVAEPYTIFESKLIGDARTILWADVEVSGGSTGSTYDIDDSSVTLDVANLTAGVRVRQTKRRFNYQPGKSQLILMTGVLNMSGGGTGITQQLGYFDDENGLFLRNNSSGVSVNMRSFTSGAAVTHGANQKNWNLDTLDGNGPSGMNIDWAKTHIFVMDFEWLGVGTARFGIVLAGKIVYCHVMDHSNALVSPYMTTPNLPLRYELINDGTGGVATLKAICGTVSSEGGVQATGENRTYSSEGTHLAASVADTLYAALGLRLKSTHLGIAIKLLGITMLGESNTNFEWQILLNPTVADSPVFAAIGVTALEGVRGDTANTVTNGTLLYAGFGPDRALVTGDLFEDIPDLGALPDGTRDTIYLCCRPLSNTAVIQSTITWKEHL